jgi:threonine dehydratase
MKKLTTGSKSVITKLLISSNSGISRFIHKTPVATSALINALAGSSLYFKCENFQKTGSFKIRGAMNAVLTLRRERLERGVVTHSSGNFAQALAYAAKCRGIKALIVMPQNVIPAKRDAVLGYGAKIIYSGNKPEDREEKCNEIIKRTGAAFIHPSNNINVIRGHASCAIELINEINKLDFVFTPVGGGGLLSGIALGFNCFSPATKIIAGEPLNADDAYRSLKAGKIIPQKNPDTIADGLRTSLGDITFPIIQKYVDDIIRVSEKEIINAMRLVWERMKIIVEPSGAVSLAAALKISRKLKNKKTGIILSGGNVDLNNLPFKTSRH